MSKLLHLFIPITRVDDEKRIVEGYAFVNEVVPGEGGMRLKRSAMEAATADYVFWGALRAMHQPIAAGTANDGENDELGVVWDDKGAFLRVVVVDDDAWKKVKTKVYKGFSVGVRADVVRGKDVEKCTWVETSLVDRPADTDAEILSFRMEGTDQDVSRIEQYITDRGMFKDKTENSEKWGLRWRALDYLGYAMDPSCLPGDDAGEAERLSREAIAEFTDYWFSRGLHIAGPLEVRVEREMKNDVDDEPKPAAEELTRLQGDNAELLKRATEAEQNLNIERDRVSVLQGEVKRLEAMPIRERPVKFIGKGIERQIGEADPNAKSVDDLQKEMADCMKRAKGETDPEAQGKIAMRVSQIKADLAELGVLA